MAGCGTGLQVSAQQVSYYQYAPSMLFRELRRTTTFRLTLLYGALFALGTVVLLWMVYLRSIVYMTT